MLLLVLLQLKLTLGTQTMKLPRNHTGLEGVLMPLGVRIYCE